jgi:hypothetical protein
MGHRSGPRYLGWHEQPSIMPATALRELVLHHVDSGAIATEIQDSPEPLSAYVLERRVIDLLAALPLVAGVSDKPKTVLDRLNQAWRSSGSLPGLQAFSVFHDGAFLPSEVPKPIPWETREDVARIERVVLDPNSANPRERLKRLREMIVDELDRDYRRAARCHRRIFTNPRILCASAPSGFSGAEQCLINGKEYSRIGCAQRALSFTAPSGTFHAQVCEVCSFWKT